MRLAPDRIGEDDDEAARKQSTVPFAITGPAAFIPRHSPERVRPRKQRNLNRTQNFCKGEDISDNGAKNYEIHITGTLVGLEKNSLQNVLESDDVLDMTAPAWSGKVRVKEGEYEGPTGWDPTTGQYYYEYTLDVVSTGAGYNDGSSGNGIINDPREEDVTLGDGL